MFGNDSAKRSIQNVVKSKEEDIIHQIQTIQALISERQNQKKQHLQSLSHEWDTIYKLFPNGHVLDTELLEKYPNIIKLEQTALSVRNSLIQEEDLAWKDIKDLKLKLAELVGELEKIRVRHSLLDQIEKGEDKPPSVDSVYDSII